MSEENEEDLGLMAPTIPTPAPESSPPEELQPGVVPPVSSETVPAAVRSGRQVGSDSVPLIMRIVPPAVGVIATLTMLQLIATDTGPSDFLYRTFQPDGELADQMVPAGIAFLLFWTLADLILKWIYVAREARKLTRPEINRLPVVVAEEGALEAMRSLDELPRNDRHRPTVSRLLALLESLAGSGNVQRAHESFKHQAELAADKAAAGYSTARVFIWAMPILGFIGTVLGIGSAVGDFSGFLTGDIDDVELVKTELAKIANGLSYAFDTTLLGLLASLPSMVFMSFVQKAEDNLGAALEGLGLGIIASVRDVVDDQLITPVPSTPLDDELLTKVAAGLDSLDSGFRTLDLGVKSLDATSSALRESTSSLERSMSESGRAQTGVQTALVALQTSTTQVAEEIGGASSSVKTSTEGFVRELTSLVDSLPQRMSGAAETQIEGMTAAGSNLASSIELSARKLTRAFDGMAVKIEELEGDRDQTNELGRIVRDLAREVTKLQEVQGKSLDSLQQLSQPMEFRIVPSVDGDGQN